MRHKIVLSSFIFALLSPAPAVLAQNECTPVGTDPADNGATADSFVCDGPIGTYTGGVTYDSDGNLTVESTVHRNEFGGNGIVLTGNGTDGVSFLADGVSIESRDTTGALLDIATDTGDIAVTTSWVDADGQNAAGVTHAIRAISSGGGNVGITTAGSFSPVDAQGENPADAIGIEARSLGGGSVTITTADNVLGEAYGIVAETTGEGNLTLLFGDSVQADNTNGIAGLHTITGTGDLEIEFLVSGISQTGPRGGAGTGALIDAGGDVTFTGSASGDTYGIDLVDVAAGTTSTLNLAGNSTTGGIAAIRAAGDGDVIVNILGEQNELDFDFTGMSNNVPVNIVTGGSWAPGTTSSVPANIVEVNIAEEALLVAGEELSTAGSGTEGLFEDATVVSFTETDSVLTNNGFIVVGPKGTTSRDANRTFEAELQLVGLSEFRNAGRVLLGGRGTSTGADSPTLINGILITTTDGWHDDILTLDGGTWIGAGGDVVFDVDTGLSQSDCTRDPDNGDLAAADCLRIVDGATEGVTHVTLRERIVGDRGRLNTDGIVLVETPGSTSAQGDFVVGPETPGYSPLLGGSLSKGVFQYVIGYDEDAEHHALYGVVSGDAHQFPLLSSAAQDVWRMSTGTWFDRQADLRETMDFDRDGGAWLRATTKNADRDVINTSRASGGNAFDFDNTHEQSGRAITVGIDMIRGGGGGSAFVFGMMAGYAFSELTYDVSLNEQEFEGWTGGVYASYVAGSLFVDAAINTNSLVMDNDTPGFNFIPEGTILSSDLISYGAQVEAGYRFDFDGGLFAEPLAALSYIRGDYDEIEIKPFDPNRPGLLVNYEDPESLRGSLGGRIGWGGELFGGMRTEVSVLGRVGNEFEGENTARIHNAAFPEDPDVLLTDDISGDFAEVGLNTSIFGANGTSGYLNVGGEFGDDYDATSISAGVRVKF